MSMLSQAFSVIIDRGTSAPGHGMVVVYFPNNIDKKGYLTVNTNCATARYKRL